MKYRSLHFKKFFEFDFLFLARQMNAKKVHWIVFNLRKNLCNFVGYFIDFPKASHRVHIFLFFFVSNTTTLLIVDLWENICFEREKIPKKKEKNRLAPTHIIIA